MLLLCAPNSPPAVQQTPAMPYAPPAEKQDASVMAKPSIPNTSIPLPVASLLIRVQMVTSNLDPSPISNCLNPESFKPFMAHILCHSLHSYVISFIPFSFPLFLYSLVISLITLTFTLFLYHYLYSIVISVFHFVSSRTPLPYPLYLYHYLYSFNISYVIPFIPLPFPLFLSLWSLISLHAAAFKTISLEYFSKVPISLYTKDLSSVGVMLPNGIAGRGRTKLSICDKWVGQVRVPEVWLKIPTLLECHLLIDFM